MAHWKIIEQMYKDNPDILVKHHIDSYHDFLEKGIPAIFAQNNPLRLVKEDASKKELDLYFGGKDGTKIYYGKPVIYDDEGGIHYMYPNEARLRNMTYGMSIHYDIDVEVAETDVQSGEVERKTFTLKEIFLGRFPIMVQSHMCLLHGMDRQARYYLGECKNDPGGYFIIDGKEKVVVSQETFANNQLYIRDKVDDIYSHGVDIKTVSEDPSKPRRTFAIRLVKDVEHVNEFNQKTKIKQHGEIVALVPNVKKPVPLFILMRALGIISDKEIIETCLLDMERFESFVNEFRPSVHDAGMIFTQQDAIRYIATLTKGRTVTSVLDILMNYFLPHIGTSNFKEKAYFLGYMVKRMLNVKRGVEQPTDRDSYKYKRLQITGTLLYDLFLEYYKKQKDDIRVIIDKRYYFHQDKYQENFFSLIQSNYESLFQNKIVEKGFRKAFKGNWGSKPETQKEGIIQDLNRLSFFSFISHLRKMNLPMDSTSKVVKPRLLHTTQWGIICPVHTPDGGNIGFHKHLAVGTHISAGITSQHIKLWLKELNVLSLQGITKKELHYLTKVIVNGSWIGVVEKPFDCIDTFKTYRRNGYLNSYTSIHMDYYLNEIHICCDAGRLMRPLRYIHMMKPYSIPKEFSWKELFIGKGNDEKERSEKSGHYLNREDVEKMDDTNKVGGGLEYIDSLETESSYIAMYDEDIKEQHTHVEIHPSLALSELGNMVIFAENNQLPRDLFSCGQTKQAASLYSSNYINRIDKMGFVLNYGQNPLIKSRYLDYICKEEHPYGENAIVAIMCYSGYNVEDALIFNKGAIDRGLFRTTYFNMYETFEEMERGTSGREDETNVKKQFLNIQNNNVVRQKVGYDYGQLDENGIIREGTKMQDNFIVIGKASVSKEDSTLYYDDSIKPKKGQLGYVDKSFITDGQEGKRIAKVRIREDRIPAIGDKFCSRAGQKGTIGIILEEEDMPFTADGIRPDIIVNPHAIPSRMTIGHLVECLMGKACLTMGGYGNCTAFETKGPQHELYGSILSDFGFHSSGNELLYNGFTGEQLESQIFFGPNYYLRLKHMVKDKINYRARGPRTSLTRQTVSGRANDGGLRIGEMERDCLIAHGMSVFVQESMMERGDKYKLAICNQTGAIAIYNEPKRIFLSPNADGPIQFQTELNGDLNVKSISTYGKEFSIVSIPYSFKLLMQELQTMNVSMRLITEDNIDQMTTILEDSKVLDYKTIVEEIRNTKEEGEDKDVEAEMAPQKKRKDVKPERRIAIIVPYRKEMLLDDIEGQNREEHKRKFTNYMRKYVDEMKTYAKANKDILLEVDMYIMEQEDDSKKFNRGALLNAGYDIAMKKHNYASIIFHDIDILPYVQMIPFYLRALQLDIYQKPFLHLTYKMPRYAKDESYLGGVLLVHSSFFNRINGYPNDVFGWGGAEHKSLMNRGLYFKDSISMLVDRPVDIEDNKFMDLENIDDYETKRSMMMKFKKLHDEHKEKRIERDAKNWKVNGLRNKENKPFYKVLEKDENEYKIQILVSDTMEEDYEMNIDEVEEKEENSFMMQQPLQQPVQPVMIQPVQQPVQQPVITQPVQQPEQSQNSFTTIRPLQQPTLNLKPIVDEIIEDPIEESNTSSMNLFKKPMIQIEPIAEEQSVDKTENPNVKTIKVDTESLQLNNDK